MMVLLYQKVERDTRRNGRFVKPLSCLVTVGNLHSYGQKSEKIVLTMGFGACMARKGVSHMFTMMMIPDANKFLGIVEKSAGSVFLYLPDHTRVDLKQDHTARQFLRLMTQRKNGFQFSLSEPSDLPAFFRYMKECVRNE